MKGLKAQRQARALKICPVGKFSEGASLQGGHKYHPTLCLWFDNESETNYLQASYDKRGNESSFFDKQI
jgi:hypothetical protein